MSHTRMITSAFFYFWSYLPFLCLILISCLCSVKRIPFGIFDDAWYKCRTGRDDVLRSRMTTVAGSRGEGVGGIRLFFVCLFFVVVVVVVCFFCCCCFFVFLFFVLFCFVLFFFPKKLF